MKTAIKIKDFSYQALAPDVPRTQSLYSRREHCYKLYLTFEWKHSQKRHILFLQLTALLTFNFVHKVERIISPLCIVAATAEKFTFSLPEKCWRKRAHVHVCYSNNLRSRLICCMLYLLPRVCLLLLMSCQNMFKVIKKRNLFLISKVTSGLRFGCRGKCLWIETLTFKKIYSIRSNKGRSD